MSDGAARRNRYVGPLVLIAAAALATAPLIVYGFSCGHDFDFHAVSWLDALSNWRQGIFYPHWSPTPNFGAGEPRFIFYPPLTWMLGALLGAMLPWTAVAPALTFLLLAGIGLATRALARQAIADGPATLAGCIAIFSGYTLFTTYERSAYAELAGGIWMPLLLLLILREGRDANARPSSWLRRAVGGSALPLALVIAASWLTNAPVGVMSCYLLAATALAVALLHRSWFPILRAATGTALGLGLGAFYLIPAAYEQRWVDIRQATDDPGLLIQNSFLFGHHSNPQLALHDTELFKVSCIAVTMIALTLLAIAICAQRGKLPRDRRWWLPLALLPLGVLLLQLPISLPLWNLLPKLRFLQFPWRWLVSLGAPMGLFVAVAVWINVRWKRRVLIGICTVVFATLAFIAGYAFHQECDEEDVISNVVQVQHNGTGVQGTDEYAPPGADNTLVAMNLPTACLVSDPMVVLGKAEPDNMPQWSSDQQTCRAVYRWTTGSSIEHKRMRADVSSAGYLILRLRQYPAWRIVVNGKVLQSMPTRDDGLIAVPVSQGGIDLRIDWTTTSDVRIGRWISILALLLVTALGVLLRKPPFAAQLK